MEEKEMKAPPSAPKSKAVSKVMGLSIASVICSVLGLGILNSGLRNVINQALNSDFGGAIAAFIAGLAALALALLALMDGIRAFRAGVRSGMLWLWLVVSGLVSAFWLVAFVFSLFFSE